MMQPRNYSRDVIIEGLMARDNEVVRWLYLRVYRYLDRYISGRNGTPLDAMDLFHEGLLQLLEKLSRREIPRCRSIPEYLFGICRNLWLRQTRISGRFQELTPAYEDTFIATADPDFPVFSDRRELKYVLCLRHLPALDLRCRKLLEMYLDGHSTETIRHSLTFLNRNALYRKKFGCLRKLSMLIRKDPDYRYL